jgi:hypothetical protein
MLACRAMAGVGAQVHVERGRGELRGRERRLRHRVLRRAKLRAHVREAQHRAVAAHAAVRHARRHRAAGRRHGVRHREAQRRVARVLAVRGRAAQVHGGRPRTGPRRKAQVRAQAERVRRPRRAVVVLGRRGRAVPEHAALVRAKRHGRLRHAVAQDRVRGRQHRRAAGRVRVRVRRAEVARAAARAERRAARVQVLARRQVGRAHARRARGQCQHAAAAGGRHRPGARRKRVAMYAARPTAAVAVADRTSRLITTRSASGQKNAAHARHAYGEPAARVISACCVWTSPATLGLTRWSTLAGMSGSRNSTRTAWRCFTRTPPRVERKATSTSWFHERQRGRAGAADGEAGQRRKAEAASATMISSERGPFLGHIVTVRCGPTLRTSGRSLLFRLHPSWNRTKPCVRL